MLCVPFHRAYPNPLIVYPMTYWWLNGMHMISYDTVAYIYSYLENRKQYVRINTTQSYLGDIT